jgi:hypothetical protein
MLVLLISIGEEINYLIMGLLNKLSYVCVIATVLSTGEA